jgi:pimeloyl-ACP methyl ester carboxylesterase
MDLRLALTKVVCPTMILCGDQDHNTGPETAQILTHLIPKSQLKIFEGSGHFPNIEVPERFNDAIGAFVC